MTNDKAFKSLLKDASPIELALLRERVLLIMEMTREDINKNPENWNNPIVHSNQYIRLGELVDKHLGFDK